MAVDSQSCIRLFIRFTSIALSMESNLHSSPPGSALTTWLAVCLHAIFVSKLAVLCILYQKCVSEPSPCIISLAADKASFTHKYTLSCCLLSELFRFIAWVSDRDHYSWRQQMVFWCLWISLDMYFLE